jgi:amidohydrolase
MARMDIMGGSWSDVVSEAAAWRHHLHQHPELAFKECNTADFVASQLTQFGLRVHRGLGGTGVVGTLVRGGSRRCIGIRADMDALPIQEQTGAAHASRTPGVMHACGHDGHVAMLLAAARICAQLEDLDGTAHFIFQPAEEAEGGGRRMVEDGLFVRFPCDEVFALHNWPALPFGTCVARDGPMMAALAVFEIEVRGRGCHGAMPHEGIDPVVAACQIVTALQSIVSRNVDPLQAAVISTTQIHAGDSWNAICDGCVIRGTARWFDDRVGDLIERRIGELSKSIAEGFGCEARFKYMRRYPATINDAAAASLVRSVAAAAPNSLKLLDVPPSTASEDFAFMLQAVRGAYFWLGSGKPGVVHGLHSPQYDFNDDLLPTGVTLWVNIVRNALSGPELR